MKLRISLLVLLLVWFAVSLLIFITLVGDRQRTGVSDNWCGDLFMVAEESETGYVYTCTADYGDE